MPPRTHVARDRHLDANQKQILTALESIGLTGRRVLDIGCGKGGLHKPLLDAGAEHVVGVEINPAYLLRARSAARSLGIDQRLRYLEGDFVSLADRIDRADITILDKAVHCYEDPERLVRQAASHSIRYFVLSLPKNKLWFRCLLAFTSAILRWLPESWRPVWRVKFSSPEKVRAWIEGEGFVQLSQEETALFFTEVYSRTPDPSAGPPE